MVEYDFFIASSYKNKDILLDFIHVIRDRGYSCYCFVDAHGSAARLQDIDTDSEEAIKCFDAIGDWQHDATVRSVFETDMQALRSSRTVILFLPAGESAHMEAGMAYGLQKRLILIGKTEKTETGYLACDALFDSVEAFFASLT